MTPWVPWRLKGAAQRGVACWDSSCSSPWVSSPHPPGLLCSPPAQGPQWLMCTDSSAGHLGPLDPGWPWKTLRGNKGRRGLSLLVSLNQQSQVLSGLPSLRDSLLLGQEGLKRFRPQALWGQKWLVSSLWMSLYTLTPWLAPKRHSVSTLCMHALGMPH